MDPVLYETDTKTQRSPVEMRVLIYFTGKKCRYLVEDVDYFPGRLLL